MRACTYVYIRNCYVRICYVRNYKLSFALLSEIWLPAIFVSGVPVLPIYLQLFSDKFATYKRAYRSSHGFYFSLGNLPRAEAAKSENILTVGLGEEGIDII